MKYRTSTQFPGYRFYRDGRIMNESTRKVLRKKKLMKICNKSINTPKLLARIFKIPNPYNSNKLGFKDNDPNNLAIDNLYWVHKPPIIKATPTKNKKKKDHYSKYKLNRIKEDVYKRLTWDDIVRKYNIPIGSIGYVINKALGGLDSLSSSKRLVINIKINKIVIK